MSKERLIVNEVIVVPKVRDGAENMTLPALPEDPKERAAVLASTDFKTALKKKFKYILDTTIPEAGKEFFKSGAYFQLRMLDFGGNTQQLPNGKTIKISRATNKLAWRNIFKASQGVTFDEIKEEILANNFDVISNGEDGQIKLNAYGLKGFWDEFQMGFAYNPHSRSLRTGKMEPLMAHPKNDDGTYRTEKAVARTGRHFVLEGEAENLEGLREDIRIQQKKYIVNEPVSTEAGQGAEQDVHTEKEEKPGKKGASKESTDDL